jgi:hypothetical protein
LYPGCTHVNDDEGKTDLCGCHVLDLIKAVERKKRENPYFFRGKSPHKIREHLTRIEILQLLNVDERTIRNIVSEAKPPYDFEMTTIGKYENERERLNLKFAQFKSKYYDMIEPRAKAFCSIFFIHYHGNDALELLMFRTKSKHIAGELEKTMPFIIPRLKEIIFAQDGYPFDEWNRHISYEGHYYHYV